MYRACFMHLVRLCRGLVNTSERLLVWALYVLLHKFHLICLGYRNGVWSFVLDTKMGCGHLSWIPKLCLVSGPDWTTRSSYKTQKMRYHTNLHSEKWWAVLSKQYGCGWNSLFFIFHLMHRTINFCILYFMAAYTSVEFLIILTKKKISILLVQADLST